MTCLLFSFVYSMCECICMHISGVHISYVCLIKNVRPKKTGHVNGMSSYIARNNKGVIFMHPYLHDVLSKLHQIYSNSTPGKGGHISKISSKIAMSQQNLVKFLCFSSSSLFFTLQKLL